MSEKQDRYLICLDGSDNSVRAAKWAGDLAARTDAALTLLHVVEWDSHAWASAEQFTQLPVLHEQLESEAWSTIVMPVEQSLTEAGLKVESQIVSSSSWASAPVGRVGLHPRSMASVGQLANSGSVVSSVQV